MGNAAYIGVNSKAKKVKKIYIGIGGKARKVKRAYIGVNGKARLFYVSGTTVDSVSYFRTAENLSVGRYRLAATTLGDYALFAGGIATEGGYYSGNVDAYNTSLIHTVAAVMQGAGRQYIGATYVGDYALFAGGDTGSSHMQIVNTYDKSLTSGWRYLPASRSKLGAAHVGNYALFAGGVASQYSGAMGDVYVFDSSLVVSTAENLSVNRSGTSGSDIGNLAIFAGGLSSSTGNNAVDIYNNALTHSYTQLASASYELAGAKTYDYALFGGGWAAGANAIIYSFNRSGVQGATASLSKARAAAAASANGVAIFGGGGDGYVYDIVDAVDNSLTVKTLSRGLSEKNSNSAAASVGNYALFAGGSMYTGAYVDVYKVE